MLKNEYEINTFHGTECNQSDGETIGVVDILHRPVCFLLNDGHSLDGIEKEVLFRVIFDKCVNQKRISLGVNVFHGHLEAIEATGLGHLYFCAKILGQIFIYNTIRSGEEGQHILDEMTFIIV